MPELFAGLSTIAHHVVGYTLIGMLLLTICLPILAGMVLAGAYAVMVYRSAVKWVTDDDEGEEMA